MGGLIVTAYIPRYYVSQLVATSNQKYLDAVLTQQIIQTGVMRHDDEKCFWTDTYYSTKAEMERVYKIHEIEIIDHFAQEGLTPLFSDKVDNWVRTNLKYVVNIITVSAGKNLYWEQVIM